MIKIFCGSERYCAKRLKELRREGWRISASKKWSDGRYTYTMVLENRENVYSHFTTSSYFDQK